MGTIHVITQVNGFSFGPRKRELKISYSISWLQVVVSSWANTPSTTIAYLEGDLYQAHGRVSVSLIDNRILSFRKDTLPSTGVEFRFVLGEAGVSQLPPSLLKLLTQDKRS